MFEEPHRHLAWLPAVVLALGVVMPPSSADHILLKNGNRIRGEVIETTDEGIRVQLPSGIGFIPHEKYKEIVKEDPKHYFKSEAKSFLERGLYSHLVKFAERGKKRFPDEQLIADMGEAGGKMVEAREHTRQMEFEKAIVLIELALTKAETSKKLRIELRRCKADHAYFKEHGSLPGDFRQLEGKRSIVLHHHYKKAEGWSKLAEAAIDRQWKKLRRSPRNKISEESRFVLKVYRDRAEYQKAVGDPAKRPRGILPTTSEAREVSRMSAASYMSEVDKWVEHLAARYVARQLNPDAPLWMIEGMVYGSTRKVKAGSGSTEMHLEAFRKLLDGGKLMKLTRVLGIRNYGQLDTAAKRSQYAQQSAMLLQFLTGWPGGRTTLSRALSAARTAMSIDLLKFITGKLKMPKGVGLKFDDLMPVYLAATLTKRFRFKKVADLEKSYFNYLRTGKRKR